MMQENGQLHVALVLSTATGGIPHYTAQLANALSEEAKVTVLKPQETTADSMFDDNVEIREVFRDSDLSFVNLMNLDISPTKVLSSFASYRNVSVLQKIEPDVVHFTDNLFPPTKAFSGFYGIDEEFPSVVTFHEIYEGPLSGDEGERSLYTSPAVSAGILAREFLNVVTPKLSPRRFVVHTDNHKEKLLSKGRSEDEISVISHGTYDVFEEPNEPIPEEENTVLCFGKIVPSKAIDTVVEAISIIREEIPTIKLVLVGEGKIPSEAQEIIDRHPDNFEIRNEFIPNDEVGEYFTRSQVVVVPHRNQGGHSGTLTIAYSFGKPVVASNVGEFPQLVEEAGCGLTASPDSPEEFAQAINRILKDDQFREECSLASEQLGDRITWDAVAEEHLDMYRRLHCENV